MKLDQLGEEGLQLLMFELRDLLTDAVRERKTGFLAVNFRRGVLSTIEKKYTNDVKAILAGKRKGLDTELSVVT